MTRMERATFLWKDGNRIHDNFDEYASKARETHDELRNIINQLHGLCQEYDDELDRITEIAK